MDTKIFQGCKKFHLYRLLFLTLILHVGYLTFRTRSQLQFLTGYREDGLVWSERNASRAPLLEDVPNRTASPSSLSLDVPRTLRCSDADPPSSPSPLLPFPPRRGGIVFFLHIPKTGGMTLRQHLQKRTDVWMGAVSRNRWRERVASVEALLDGWTNHTWTKDPVTFAVELHAPDNPSYREEMSRMRAWRCRARELGVPFFALTVVREPVAHAVSSFYHYVRIEKRRRAYHRGPAEDSEAGLVGSAIAHPQCVFLARGEKAYEHDDGPGSPRGNLTREDCAALATEMLVDFDWIGTTATIDEETVPILDYLLGDGRRKGRKRKPPAAAVRENTRVGSLLSANTLTEATRQHLQNITKWDRSLLYDMARKQFSFARDWKPRIEAAAEARKTKQHR